MQPNMKNETTKTLLNYDDNKTTAKEIVVQYIDSEQTPHARVPLKPSQIFENRTDDRTAERQNTSANEAFNDDNQNMASDLYRMYGRPSQPN
jgi:hypothetical protein